MSTDYDNMSDEEIMNIDISSVADDISDGESDETSVEQTEKEEQEVEEDSDKSASDEESDTSESEEEEESDNPQLDDESTEVDEDSNDGDDTDKGDEESPEEKDVESDDTAKISDSDKVVGYDTLMGKIKANGIDIQVESVDDAVRLMQMGAGFHKKMEQIKPVRKIGQMLQNNNLLDESKINFLIELSNGSPEAVKQLLRDKKINPLDLDMETNTEYKPKTYTTTNQELDLNDTLGDIQDTPSGKETIDIVSNKWDDASRQTIAKHPEVLHAINEHIRSGVYKQIDDKVQSERALGKLKGMSAIDAYKHIGDLMFPVSDTKQKQEATPKQKAADAKVKSRKKASNPPKTKAPSNTPKDSEVDITQMSDEEFNKYFDSVKL